MKIETAYQEGLKKLIKEKPLDEINVVMLCEECNSNRQTFYYHFRDISDVVESIFLKAKVGYAKKLLDYVDFKGVCGIDFRYDPQTMKVAFIEVNARFTGGLATPIAAGFDIPWVLYTLATTGKCNDHQNAKIGIKTKWILGDVITLVGRLISLRISMSEMKQVFAFNGFDAYDDYYPDDKKAILGEMRYYLGKLVKNGKLNP